MPTENPYETPQASGAAPDNRRLHKRARMCLRLAVACFIVGFGFLDVAMYMIHGQSDGVAARRDTNRGSEVANDFTRSAAIVESISKVGFLLTITGGLAVVPSGILWFVTRNANKTCEKDLQRL